MTGRIQFREDEEVIQFVESLGKNPNEFARKLFEREVRRLKAEKRHERLSDAAIRLPESAASLVREDRDR